MLALETALTALAAVERGRWELAAPYGLLAVELGELEASCGRKRSGARSRNPEPSDAPLMNISDIRKIDTVIKAGAVIYPKELTLRWTDIAIAAPDSVPPHCDRVRRSGTGAVAQKNCLRVRPELC
jgi:hypothetical protein